MQLTIIALVPALLSGLAFATPQENVAAGAGAAVEVRHGGYHSKLYVTTHGCPPLPTGQPGYFCKSSKRKHWGWNWETREDKDTESSSTVTVIPTGTGIIIPIIPTGGPVYPTGTGIVLPPTETGRPVCYMTTVTSYIGEPTTKSEINPCWQKKNKYHHYDNKGKGNKESYQWPKLKRENDPAAPIASY